MRRLIFSGLALMLVLCACQNSLDIKTTELEGVDNSVLIESSLLKEGDSYAIGYGNGNIRSDRVRLSWTPCTNDNFLCYKVIRNNIIRHTILNPETTAITDSLLIQDSGYDYRLVCFLKNGMAVDDTISIRTPIFLPPNQLDYEFLTSTSLYLTWNNNAETATGYVIEKINYSTSVITFLESTTESYTDNQAVDTGTYGYRVRAENQFETTGWTPWLVIDNSLVYDFESDNGGFTNLPISGWQWGQDNSAGANSGSNIWGTVLNGNYANNALYMLMSPALTVPPVTVLDFYQRYDIENSWDGGNVKISIDGGTTWALIYPNSGYPLANVLSSGEPGYSGALPEWTQAVFDLSAYAGQSVRFMWTLTSDSSVTMQGWFIDDVRVGPETDGKLTR
jgi:hypothetical protein